MSPRQKLPGLLTSRLHSINALAAPRGLDWHSARNSRKRRIQKGPTEVPQSSRQHQPARSCSDDLVPPLTTELGEQNCSKEGKRAQCSRNDELPFCPAREKRGKPILCHDTPNLCHEESSLGTPRKLCHEAPNLCHGETSLAAPRKLSC